MILALVNQSAKCSHKGIHVCCYNSSHITWGHISKADFALGLQCRCPGLPHLEPRLLMVQNLRLHLPSSSEEKRMLLPSLTLERCRVRSPFFLKNRHCPWLLNAFLEASFFFFDLLLDWNTREHSAAVCFHDYFSLWDVFLGQNRKKCSINKALTRRGNTEKEGTPFLYKTLRWNRNMMGF